jgi:hypothetical protein
MNNELRLAEIEVELQNVEKEIEEREKTDPNEGWDVYCDHMEEVWEKRDKLNREKRMLMIPEFNDIPDYADVMSLKDFIENVNFGGFIDDDGSGSYVRDGKESNISIYPSDIMHGCVRKDFDSVAWYNK